MNNCYVVTCDVLIRKKYYVSDPSPDEATKTAYGIVAHEYKENALLEDSETLQIHVAHCEKEGDI